MELRIVQALQAWDWKGVNCKPFINGQNPKQAAPLLKMLIFLLIGNSFLSSYESEASKLTYVTEEPLQ